MQISLNINEYDKLNGLQLAWEKYYKIEVKDIQGEIMIRANSEGLLSLANHLVNLAQYDVPINTHIHLDEYNSLEEGSLELVIQKIE